MKSETSSGGIVVRKFKSIYKVLLILDNYNSWTFPKGHLENNETLEEAALREIREETGLNELELIKLIDKIEYTFRNGNILIHKNVYIYLLEATGDEEINKQEEEIKDARWFDAGAALEIIGYPAQNKPLLVKACGILGIN